MNFQKIFLAAMLAALSLPVLAQTGEKNDYRVEWDSPGKDYRYSMPLGNGDLGINLWTEENGDILVLLSKTDSWTENGQLAKLGRVRLHFDQPLFGPGKNFRQSLLPFSGQIKLSGDHNSQLHVWMDIDQPVLHFEFSASVKVNVRVSGELWRTKYRWTKNNGLELSGQGSLRELSGIPAGGVTIDPDSVLKARTHAISWVHCNQRSIYPLVFENQHLESLLKKYPDPLLGSIFGAAIESPDLRSVDDRTLATGHPVQRLCVNIIGLTRKGTLNQWNAEIEKIKKRPQYRDLITGRRRTQDWWKNFWHRSWIHVNGDSTAESVTQGYAMQRWMTGSSGRGPWPIKYNGGIYTTGQEPSGSAYDAAKGQMDPDFRAWGGNYWFQNTRLLYWPMLASGDHDMLAGLFSMYLRALPLAKDRTFTYYKHPGAAFPETIYFWGLPNNNDFGWNNPDTLMTNTWIRRYVSGGLELVTMALQEYHFEGHQKFLRDTLLPLATEIISYYDHHWPRINGRLHLAPAQAIETRQQAVNPAPDIAGLHYVLPQLLRLPLTGKGAQVRRQWEKLLAELPEIPVGRTDSSGHQPQVSEDQSPQGGKILLDALTFTKAKNVENPALYSIFPYTLYGIGLPDLPLARDTYEARLFPASTCWTQDGIQAAILGLPNRARKEVVANFTEYGKEKFKWFWAKGHDWEPDLDNGGAGQLTLQSMLLQTRGQKIYLFPAWPRGWDVDFKLWAPGHTCIKAVLKKGRVVRLSVWPSSRRKDLVSMIQKI